MSTATIPVNELIAYLFDGGHDRLAGEDEAPSQERGFKGARDFLRCYRRLSGVLLLGLAAPAGVGGVAEPAGAPSTTSGSCEGPGATRLAKDFGGTPSLIAQVAWPVYRFCAESRT